MIDIKNVSKWYGPVQVITDCSVRIKKGDVVVVCGRSGSGKSPLAGGDLADVHAPGGC